MRIASENHIQPTRELDELVSEYNDNTPIAITLTGWTKRAYVKDIWEIKLAVGGGKELVVSVYGTTREPVEKSAQFINTALCVQDTLHLWRENIIAEVAALSREWGAVTEEKLRGNLTLSHVQFDAEGQLSAIYFQTPCLSGHQVVVEFDSKGDPYEAEITG